MKEEENRYGFYSNYQTKSCYVPTPFTSFCLFYNGNFVTNEILTKNN
ncbi:YoaP domain-containing protein [Candidatus Galacturonibacter soehngenii]|uniref:YoaP-like domain-containing protein n=1 Tax=Candidatus Galacturonatibacter soehngenii TaxID=2307010 RepID=A0A7V7UHQ0_9FIRM|nr:hypothetical protein F7O84_04290 [Candidatus Galacturonibacter soehngenii]